MIGPSWCFSLEHANPRYLCDLEDNIVHSFHSSGASHMSAKSNYWEKCGTLKMDWNSLVMNTTDKGNFNTIMAESQQGHS